MQVVNNRFESKKSTFTVQQMLFIGIKGLGHLAVMAAVIQLFTSFIYFTIGSANLLDSFTGLLLFAGGHQLQQLGDRLDERHMLNTNYLDLAIKQLITRIVAISVIVTAILTI